MSLLLLYRQNTAAATAILAGTAAVVMSASGTLVPTSVLSGTAAVTVSSSGTLQQQASVLAGTAQMVITATGALVLADVIDDANATPYHYLNNCVTQRGDALPNWQVKAVLPGTNSPVPIFSDISGTPIIAVSGFANTAITSDIGNYDFFIDEGSYDLLISDNAGVFRQRLSRVPMFGIPSVAPDLSNVDWSAVSPEVLSAMFTAMQAAGVFNGFLGV